MRAVIGIYIPPEHRTLEVKGGDEVLISIVVGTRPEIIKMSPIIKECKKRNLDFFILHSGQHYSYNLDEVFFQQLSLPEPTFNLEIGSAPRIKQICEMMAGMDRVFRRERPDVVLVEGDTNTVLAGALSASKLDIDVGHVEAGLRSFDSETPEEYNRIVADHCSRFLFAPTQIAVDNLLREGIENTRIHITGNTIVDSVYSNLGFSMSRKNILHQFGLDKGDYFLATVHRQENVDREERFKGIISGLKLIGREFKSPVVYPIHPRAAKNLKSFRIKVDGIKIVPPLDYWDFLQLLQNAKLVLTDSGGVQEEACAIGTRCVTLRRATERPETLMIGANVLAAQDPKLILEKVGYMLNQPEGWGNPYGDGRASERIVNIITGD